ncbi:hypothetical protein JOF53_005987 [Crossiella equi]|uniref:VanZ-like domain-containing protein n=1 Tax=Crossiella equi TaxID=130796 RepID=A0ABS5AN42_9PSEU|nr:VanZ family protein [Crossiella equi]MBP2477115.1 hypothetical protein [Crossiella equi]
MGLRVLPAWVAAIAATAVALVLFVPYVAVRYRRRGDLGAGDAVLAFAFLLYLLALVAYALIPLPPVGPEFCQYYDWVHPQLRPLYALSEWPQVRTWRDLPRLLTSGSFRSWLLNVAFFVPLGVFTRHLFRRGLFACVLLGLGISLLIELTQLTGVWWIYPCAFRVFDVDDLITNTLGTGIGVLFAPLLRLVPGQHAPGEAGAPQPVTRWRRLLGMLCDLLLVWWAGNALALAASAFGLSGPWVPAWAEWWVPALVLLVLTAFGRGASPGQLAVRLRPVQVAGPPGEPGLAAPGLATVLVRWLTGLGGAAVLFGYGTAPSEVPGAPLAWGAAVALLLVHGLFALFGRGTRGISGLLSGLELIDARTPDGGRAPAARRRATNDRQDG